MGASSPIRSRKTQELAPMGRSYAPKEVPLGGAPKEVPLEDRGMA